MGYVFIREGLTYDISPVLVQIVLQLVERHEVDHVEVLKTAESDAVGAYVITAHVHLGSHGLKYD